MKINIAFAAVVLLLFSCKTDTTKQTSDVDVVLSKQQMLEDFNLFQSIYEKANAGLYKYRTKQSVDSIFEVHKKAITGSRTFREFYNTIWEVIDFTGSCHNELTYPQALDSTLNTKAIFFPLPLKYLSRKLYTNLKTEKIPLGSEIISIDEVPANEVAKKISKYVSTDGFNKTGKYANIATDWMPFYMYLSFGKKDTFSVNFKTSEGAEETALLSAVDYRTFMKNYKKRFSKPFDDRYTNDYNYTYIDSINSGLLTVSTFAVGGPKSDGHKAYAHFLDSVFTELKGSKTKNLIVDIRGNGGGNDPNDLLLYSYLTKRNFRENTTAFTIFQDIPHTDYYIDDDIEELPVELKEEHSIVKGEKYYQNANFNKVWQPHSKAFQGDIYVLIDPYVASAASLFASLIKSDDSSIVVGEESLGGYYGHTGHIPVNYELPNSKLILTFSIVDLEQDIQQLPDQNYGDGVKPDWQVSQTYQDFMQNKDTQLMYLINAIKEDN